VSGLIQRINATLLSLDGKKISVNGGPAVPPDVAFQMLTGAGATNAEAHQSIRYALGIPEMTPLEQRMLDEAICGEPATKGPEFVARAISGIFAEELKKAMQEAATTAL